MEQPSRSSKKFLFSRERRIDNGKLKLSRLNLYNYYLILIIIVILFDLYSEAGNNEP